MSVTLPHQSQKPRIVAHRGRLLSGQSENALSAIRACLDAGLDAIEIDLKLSADGTLWLLHDDHLDRVTNGSGRIDSATDETLCGLRLRGSDGHPGEEGLARFDEVLDLITTYPETLLMLDLKATPPGPVIAALHRFGRAENALILTFSWTAAEDALQISSAARVSVLISDDADFDRALTLAALDRLAFYLPQDAAPALFARAATTGALVVTDALMIVADGSLDNRADTGGAIVYRQFCAERPSGLIVSDRPLSLRDALEHFQTKWTPVGRFENAIKQRHKSFRSDSIRTKNALGPDSLLSLRDLRISFSGTEVVHGVDMDVGRSETLGIVGESGCGKSVSWLAALGLLPESAFVSGSIRLDGAEIVDASMSRLDDIRGKRIAMIFQDPSSSLNPVIRVGEQIAEALRLHRGLSPASAREEALNLMLMVGIPNRRNRYNLYPHEFSGGQAQRLMIAMALAGKPDILIADEPTTALDATIQAQILALLNRLCSETGMALVFISHDLGAVSQVCKTITVMYAGRVVETRRSEMLLENPRHPYTLGLIRSIPSLDGPPGDLPTIPGAVPDPARVPRGCAFASRCSQAIARCTEEVPPLVADLDGAVACWMPLVANGTAP